MYASVKTPRFQRRSRRNLAPAIIVGIVLLIFFCWVFNVTCGKKKSPNASKLGAFVNEVRPAVDSSNMIAQDWHTLKGSILQEIADPNKLDAKLKALVDRSKEAYDKAAAVAVPQGMEQPAAALIQCLDQRYRGMEQYRSDLLNAVATLDLDVFSRNMGADSQQFLYSDGAYAYFKSKAGDILRQRNLNDISIVDSQWILSLDELNPDVIKGSLQVARGSELHGVAVATVKLDPAGTVQTVSGDDVHILPATDEMNVTVTIENQGNRKETGLTVTATLYSETNSNPQQMQSIIDNLEAGATVEVVFKGLKPTTGGVRNILELKVNPVPGESFTDNNSKVLYLTMSG